VRLVACAGVTVRVCSNGSKLSNVIFGTRRKWEDNIKTDLKESPKTNVCVLSKENAILCF
jgi:hypothetical protein